MIKTLKIAYSEVPIQYLDLSKTDYDGQFVPTKNCIEIDSTILDEKHDGTLLHELIHAVTHNTGLIHTSISTDMWEIIAHEISEAISKNFKLTPR